MRDKERNTLVHAAARGGLPALAGDLVDMLGADAIGLQNAQGESALDVASGAGVGMALMRRVPAEVLRTMDMTRVPWLHQSLRTLVVPLLLNDASVTSVDLASTSVPAPVGGGGRAGVVCRGREAAAAAGRRRPGRVCAHVGAPCVGGPAARDAAVSVVRAVRCGGVLPLVARCAFAGLVVVARCCCSGAVCLRAGVVRMDTRPGSCVHARGRGAAHPPVLCPRRTLKPPLAPGSMLR